MGIVVASAIIEDSQVLVAQRSYPPEHAGKWEFPGGAVENGETEHAAVERECWEELATHVIAGARIGPAVPIGTERELHLWSARLVPDAAPPSPTEHLAVKWVDAVELTELNLLDADLVFLPAICELLTP